MSQLAPFHARPPPGRGLAVGPGAARSLLAPGTVAGRVGPGPGPRRCERQSGGQSLTRRLHMVT
eukprot:768351-Hanusia_phi.AAC.15